MYVSKKRIMHELAKILSNKEDSKADIIRLALLEELDIITYSEYISYVKMIKER